MRGVFLALEKENKFEYYFKPEKIIDEIKWTELKIQQLHEQGMNNEFFSISFHNYQIAGQFFTLKNNKSKKHLIGFLLNENTNPILYRSLINSLISFVNSLIITNEDAIFEEILEDLTKLIEKQCTTITVNNHKKKLCIENKKTLYETLRENLWAF
ncbi:MAG: hypothetical protein K9W46_03805 [Candidatus Heimdallarchaeum endolithica]|uniref:Uncharacterized protein n=1 Tax=Candidatus Heimdallarchaeum endolithica TaxID=2876572 RepID=A0A9Y1BTZ3_9ARCH|nr:MAG: hypothetical protein K9W46_03805 [Candidatus Heimdallarchaeum endolithica]